MPKKNSNCCMDDLLGFTCSIVVLPPSFQLALAEMCFGRGEPVDAVVRTLMIVDTDRSRHRRFGLSKGGKACFEKLDLENPVNSLGDRVLQRIALFRHADPHPETLEQLYITGTVILRSAVRMMN